jgi:hypothetical protein
MELLGYMAFTILAAGLIGGVVLLVFGLRGRKIDDFPYCRKCRYNLTGLTSDRCPECGTVLTTSNVTIGLRRRSRRLLLVGLLIMIGCGIPLGVWGWKALRTVDWYSKKPARWVIADAADANTGIAAKAYQELLGRLQAERLSSGQKRRLAGVALTECQRVPQRTIQLEYLVLDLVNELHRRGGLTPAEISQFYESRFPISLEARPVSSLQQGIPIKLAFPYPPTLSYNVSVEPPRIQQGTLQTCGDFLSSDRYQLPELPREKPEELQNRPYRTSAKSTPWQGSEWPTMLVKAPSTGKQTLHFVVGTNIRSAKGPDAGGTLYAVKRELTVSTEVVDRDPAEIIQLITNPGMENAVRRAVTVRMGQSRPPQHLGRTWRVSISIVNPPVAVVGTAVLQIEETEIQRIIFAARGNQTSSFYFRRVQGEPPTQPLKVRLIPDPSAAVKTMSIMQIWGTPLEFTCVPANATSSAPASAPW